MNPKRSTLTLPLAPEAYFQRGISHESGRAGVTGSPVRHSYKSGAHSVCRFLVYRRDAVLPCERVMVSRDNHTINNAL